MRAFPRSLAGIMLLVGVGLLYIGVVVVGAIFLDRGMQSAPYLAALVNGCACAFLIHRFPTGEWTGEAGLA